MSPILEVHSTVHAQTVSHVELTVGKIAEAIEFADSVSKAEKAQFLEWFKDKYEELGQAIGSAKQIADTVSEGLSGAMPPEAIEIIIKIIMSI